MAGWFGPDGDCGCSCSFAAAWKYNDTEEDSLCLLVFRVVHLKSGCTVLDYDVADITVVLRRNGTLITDDLIVIPDSVSPGGGRYWEKWKPAANDVYTAEITLTCGYGNSLTREYEITIPDPANTACTCCDDRTPDFVTVSGLTGACCTPGNGTFVMSAYETCVWESVVEYDAPATADKCNAAVACDATTLGNGDIFYRHIASVLVRVGIGKNPLTLVALADANEVRVFIRVSHYGYLKRFSDGVCADDDGGASEWVFSSICASTPLDLYSTGGSNFCSGTPTVTLAFV